MALALHYDAALADDERRARLYAGDLLAYRPRASTTALCDFARELAREAFAPHDPELAQHALPVERYTAILAELKPRFIHHPESKRLIQAVLEDFGCDPALTYFDVPRLRTSTAWGYLTTGIAYAFHPHRDTWYSAPLCQLNWWLPVSPLTPENGIAFLPRYWREPVRNGSREYDYAEWNRTSRFIAASQIGKDTRRQPKPEQPLDDAGEIRPLLPAGGALLFSGAQLHSSVENRSGRTRLSIDFRTVHRCDAEEGRGAPNVDSACTGTALGDFLRAGDLTALPGELVEAHARGFGRDAAPREASA
ncbi:MAG: phytanoyl-CoA dioxygenase family protein [Myxococcota bacterium]